MDRIERIKAVIRDVPDFPKPGILFKDISPLLADPKLFSDSIDLFAEMAGSKKIDLVAGIEARGFIFGAALATRLNAGFVPIRKPGKLPYKTFHIQYDLEYGTDAIEVHQDAFANNASVFLIDDLLATGGTAGAAIKLIKKAGGQLTEVGFLIELSFLNGRDHLLGFSPKALIKY